MMVTRFKETPRSVALTIADMSAMVNGPLGLSCGS
jgi:hypothetical protein